MLLGQPHFNFTIITRYWKTKKESVHRLVGIRSFRYSIRRLARNSLVRLVDPKDAVFSVRWKKVLDWIR
ncbi:hypothetical protein D3C75_908730 [compost metagenome]